MYVFTDKAASLVPHPNVPFWLRSDTPFMSISATCSQLGNKGAVPSPCSCWIHYGSLCMKMLFPLNVHQGIWPLVYAGAFGNGWKKIIKRSVNLQMVHSLWCMLFFFFFYINLMLKHATGGWFLRLFFLSYNEKKKKNKVTQHSEFNWENLLNSKSVPAFESKLN